MKKLFAVLAMALVTTSVAAQIKVGVTLAATGPAASLGIPEKNVFALLPKTLAGMAVEVIILDDATDPSGAVKNTHKLISESNVDVIIGSSITPARLPWLTSSKATPLIALAASSRIVEPMDAKRAWVLQKFPRTIHWWPAGSSSTW